MSELDDRVQPSPLGLDAASQKAVRTSAVVGLVFTAVYLYIGIQQLTSHAPLSSAIGVACLLDATLFAVGSACALKTAYSAARVCYLIGGIMGLPLGLVMIFQGIRIKRIVAAAEQRQFEQELTSPSGRLG